MQSEGQSLSRPHRLHAVVAALTYFSGRRRRSPVSSCCGQHVYVCAVGRKGRLSVNQRALRRLRTACERAKRTLSSAAQTSIEIDSLFEGIDFYTSLTPEKVLRDSKTDKANILFFCRVRRRCPGCYPLRRHLLDISLLSLGIETAGGVFAPLIKRNTTVPTKKSEIFSTYSTTSRARSSSIPPAPRRVPQIEVTLDINANGILNVTAADKTIGKSNRITITNDKGRLSKADIDHMLPEAEKYKKEDEEAASRIQTKNGLESYTYNLRNSLQDEKLADKFELADKKKLEDPIPDVQVLDS
ncbi:HSP70-domain-containing protein [Exidia glandulosa HHB12029]|uniref:HSP70-domain-containing protein n=1 Tax=Exidia glandulosa HHB12029 TaxID=1314781 RepID=A0A165IEA9_EXIGL|nr:HSP70-domain-containing protein [Exidia glandulosa HHB12029]